MLPGVGPFTVRQGVADLVVGDGVAIVFRQQVAPLAVAVGIGDGIRGGYTFQTAGSIGIGVLCQNVAGVVVSPGVGEIACLVIFPNQLVGTVVDIACGIRAVTDRENIAIIVWVSPRGGIRPWGYVLSVK